MAQGRYRTLTSGPGEPYLPRLDVLGRPPGTGRSRTRRSLLYLGHLSDMHVIDALSPGRIEPMIATDHSAWASAFHPQDPMTVHVLAAMTRALSELRSSGFGDYGFPRLPGLLDRAIGGSVASPGLPAPWYAVYGNHDTLLLGTFEVSSQFRSLAVGGREAGGRLVPS